MHFVAVDNNESDLAHLTQALVMAMPGCETQSFIDPFSCAKYVCNHSVDMVFLADDMRPVNGFRLLQVLRKNIPQVAVAMLLNTERHCEDAIHAGVTAYLLKPVSVEKLKLMLEAVEENMDDMDQEM